MSDAALRKLQRQAVSGGPGARERYEKALARLGKSKLCFAHGHDAEQWTVRWDAQGTYCCRPCNNCDAELGRRPASNWDVENAPTTQWEFWEPEFLQIERPYLRRHGWRLAR